MENTAGKTKAKLGITNVRITRKNQKPQGKKHMSHGVKNKEQND